MSKYKPRIFTTTALQQAKVELTWDATNPNRAEMIRSALDGKIDDLDLKEYLASSSEGKSKTKKLFKPRSPRQSVLVYSRKDL
jgi:hypothetical protein